MKAEGKKGARHVRDRRCRKSEVEKNGDRVEVQEILIARSMVTAVFLAH